VSTESSLVVCSQSAAVSIFMSRLRRKDRVSCVYVIFVRVVDRNHDSSVAVSFSQPVADLLPKSQLDLTARYTSARHLHSFVRS